jgi:outer membrane protein TolC
MVRTDLVAVGVAGLLVIATAGAAAAQTPPPASSSPIVYDLHTAIEAAKRNHPTVRSAGARRDAATTKTVVAGALYRPFFEGHASIGGTIDGDRDIAFRDGDATQSRTSNPFYTTAVRLVVPVVREGTLPWLRLPSEDVAGAAQAGAQQAERLARAEAAGNASMAYYSVLATRENLRTSREVVEHSRAALDAVQRRFQQQLVPQVDVLNAESMLVSAQSQVASAQADVTKALDLFALALGLDPASARTLQVADSKAERVPMAPLDQLLQRTTTRHPSILFQQERVREAEATVDVLRTQRYPTLDAVTGIGAIDDFRSSVDAWSWRALLRLNWNIYDFGLLGLKIKQQNELVVAEKRTLEHVKSQVSQALITAYHNLDASSARLASAEKSVELASEEVRAAASRERQGLSPAAETLIARAKEAAARRALTLARYATLIEQAAVTMTTGGE